MSVILTVRITEQAASNQDTRNGLEVWFCIERKSNVFVSLMSLHLVYLYGLEESYSFMYIVQSRVMILKFL